VAADGSYCLVGGFCNTNTQFIGHNIGIYSVEYLINFQKFNLTFNFILFDIGLKNLTIFAQFSNDEDHPLSIILHQHVLASIFLCARLRTFRPITFLYHFEKCFCKLISWFRVYGV
jgi:hypothetical protein